MHGVDGVIVLQDIAGQGESQGLDPAVIVHVEDKAAPGEGIVIYPVLLDGFILQSIDPAVGAYALGGGIKALLPGLLDLAAAGKQFDAAAIDLRFDLVEHLTGILLCHLLLSLYGYDLNIVSHFIILLLIELIKPHPVRRVHVPFYSNFVIQPIFNNWRSRSRQFLISQIHL